MNFDWGFAAEILPALLRGSVFTLICTFAGMAIALVLGLGLAMARRNRVRAIRHAAVAYIEFVRNTPFLVQLYVVFYVLPQMGLRAPALLSGILALGLNYAAYTSEVYRAGIDNVPQGQWEAAQSLHLPSSSTWYDVIVPQAFKPMVPVLGNYLIGMFKETPLLSTITIVELFGAAQAVAGETYRYFEPYTVVGLVFLVMSLSAALAVQTLDRRLNRAAR